MEKYPAKIRLQLQVLRIGDTAVVGLPCEPFAETGLAIKQQSPQRKTFTISLANGFGGYLPTPAQHAMGGYETWNGRGSFLEIDAEPKIRAAVLQLLEQLQ